MHHLILRISLFCFFIVLYSSDTCSQTITYFDKAWKEVSLKEDAAYYRESHSPENGKIKVIDYYMNGNKQMEGYFLVDNDTVKEGFFIFYREDGTKESEGKYHNNQPDGASTTYRKDGATVHYTEEQVGIETLLTSYYPDGKVKRTQKTIDLRTEGTCYDTNGKQISFTPFMIMPEPSYNLTEYISKNIRYPKKARRRNIEGRVLVKFYVNEEGEIREPEVVKSVSPEIDEEARRVVAQMPRWKPGKADDEPVKVYFSQPINFRLE